MESKSKVTPRKEVVAGNEGPEVQQDGPLLDLSDATLKNKRELIKKLLRGTLRGLRFTLKNRVDTARFIAKDYKLQDAVADKVYASLLPAMSENGLATDKGLKVMVETLGTAVGKNIDFPPERLVDYTLLREVQKELGVQ